MAASVAEVTTNGQGNEREPLLDQPQLASEHQAGADAEPVEAQSQHISIPNDDPIKDGDKVAKDKDNWRQTCWQDRGFYGVVMMVAIVQGSSYLSKLAANYYFKDDLHLEPAVVSVLSGIILIPWVIKPLYGFISDTYPIFNRRRVPYFFIFGFTGFMSWISLAAFASGVVETVACLFGASLSLAFVNVLAEALIVEKGAENKKDHASTKAKISRLMTLYWGTESAAKIVAGFSSGFLLTMITKQTIFAITGIFPAILCIMAFFLNEKPSHARRDVSEQFATLWAHLRKPHIWKPAFFMFIWRATPSSHSSYFFFLTNEIKLPPQFMGTLHLIEGVSSLTGLAIYNLYLSRVSYRNILLYTMIGAFFVGLTPLILVFKLNRDWGIPDPYFAGGDAALMAGVGQMAIMPLLILGAQTCPPSVEGTLYALLMSTLNIGGVVADNLGGLLTWIIGVKSNDFTHLWLLVLICDCCNLIAIPMMYVLVPTEEEFKVIHEQQRIEDEAAEKKLLLEKEAAAAKRKSIDSGVPAAAAASSTAITVAAAGTGAAADGGPASAPDEAVVDEPVADVADDAATNPHATEFTSSKMLPY